MALDGTEITRARRALLRWYDKHARDLPWRRSRDPYAIWISEVMLQQTRVDTVTERWKRFLKRFPTVAHLARAREQSVLREWEGLGYYSRARNLRLAARQIVRDHGGQVPDTLAELRALPGFGPYISAAVASIAFGRAEAVVDGNVIRVITRRLADGGDVTRAATKKRIAQAADQLLAPRRPGDANQALMELGATVCIPRNPRCDACPWRRDCSARAEGEPTAYPNKPPRRAVPHHDIAAGLVWRGQDVLIGRRPSDGLLGGLWEFPGGKVEAGESIESALHREVAEETGLRLASATPFCAIKHAYSHFKITLHLFHCTAGEGQPRGRGTEDLRFVPWTKLGTYPFPRANRRALERLASEGGPPDASGQGRTRR